MEDVTKKLRDALEAAAAKLKAQDELLHELTESGSPVALAVVVEIRNPPKATPRIGMKVRPKPGSSWGYQAEHSNYGVVTGFNSDGWVRIKWENPEDHSNVYPPGDLIAMEPCRALVSINDSLMEVSVPPSLDVSPGDVVRMAQNGAILEKTDSNIGGLLGYVKGEVSEGLVEVEIGGEDRVIHGKGEKGDKVMVDTGMNVVLTNLGKTEEKFTTPPVAEVTWDDVGGLEEAKEQMREAIELPLTHPRLFEAYGKRPLKGILLYGPPGCGKTLLAKAAANSIARLHGSTANFLYVKGPEILDKYVGVAEQSIRQLFIRARSATSRAVVFIDEADAILGSRGSGVSSDVERTIVPAFLAEMDGFDKDGPLVILATNRADTLDSAIVRDGRIDRKIKIGRPDQKGAKSIFELSLNGSPITSGSSKGDLAFYGAEELFKREVSRIVSGAMITNIVEHATTRALKRDLEKRSKRATGVGSADVLFGIDAVERQIMEMAA